MAAGAVELGWIWLSGVERGGIGAGVIELVPKRWTWGGRGVAVDAVELGRAWLNWGRRGGIGVDAVG